MNEEELVDNRINIVAEGPKSFRADGFKPCIVRRVGSIKVQFCSDFFAGFEKNSFVVE